MSQTPPICDYEGSDYRTRFWENQDRGYEDRAERFALRRLLPPAGHTLLDVGAGFGRLAEEFQGYDRVVLFDYSRSLLREAQQRLGSEPRFIFVAGSWYSFPFVPGLFEAIVQVRTIHHAADVPSLFQELARIARPGGSYVLEFANKHNLKAILRYWARRQAWSPFAREPVEFADLNFDFHPRWIRQELKNAGFTPGRQLTVSHFRVWALKRLVPAGTLAALDRMIQFTGRWWQLSPSIFVHNQHPFQSAAAQEGEFFACPTCRTPLAEPDAGLFTCPNPGCGNKWAIRDGLYDFKEPA